MGCASSQAARLSPEHLKTLALVPFFAHLKPEELEELGSQIKVKSVEVGAVIFKQGDTCRDCYVIADGKVNICGLGVDGGEKVLAEASAPDHFGEIALVRDSCVRTATVKAAGSCTLLILTHAAYTSMANAPWMKSTARRLRLTADHRMAAYLSEFPFLGSLDQGRLQLLGALLKMEVRAAGEVVFHEGDSGDAFYIIMSGKCQAAAKREDGQETLSGAMGKGNYFGEISLLEKIPRTATVRVLEETLLLKLGAGPFDNFLSLLTPESRAVIAKEVRSRARTMLGVAVEDLLDPAQVAIGLTRASR